MLSPGTRIGAYEVIAPIGAGGMGEVYRASDSRLGREVAIKVLPAGVANDPDRLKRFDQEARAAASLSHPNILAIHDTGTEQFGDAAPFPYIVSELLQGHTLRSLLQIGEPVAVRKALNYAIQLAHGLAAAHERGIVHRDLKPENIFVTDDDVVKILDFGLARVSQAVPSSSALQTMGAVTQPGMMLGTIGYMAPEQLRGLDVDRRADVFAFGAVLHELLCGQRAFAGATPADTISAILEKPADALASSSRPIPIALRRIIERCLEKAPAARFQSTRDLAFALSAVDADLSSQTGFAVSTEGESRLFRRQTKWLLAGAALFAVGLAAGALIPQRDAVPARLTRVALQPPNGTTFSLFGNLLGAVTVARDGSQLAFVASGRVWVRPLHLLEAKAIAGTEGAAWPFWSADGEHVAFATRGIIKRVAVRSGNVDVIAQITGSFRGGSWREDGRILYSAGGRLFEVDAGGGTPRAVTAHDAARGDLQHLYPQWLPDGQRYLLLVRTRQPTTSGVYLGRVGSSELTRVVASDSNAAYADGQLFYVPRGTTALAIQPFDPDTGVLRGAPTRIAEQVGISSWPWDNLYYAPFAVSRAGVLAYHADSMVESQLTWFDRSGRTLGQVGPAAIYANPEIAPDDRQIAIDRFESLTGRTRIVVIDAERGGTGVPLHNGEGNQVGAAWAPDGKKAIFTSDSGGSPALYTKDLLTDTVRKVADPQTPAYWKSWAPRSESVFFTTVGTTVRVDQADVNSGVVRTALKNDGGPVGQAQISPDGWMAFMSLESGQTEIYIQSMSKPGRKWPVTVSGGFMPRWRGDGRELYYVTPGITSSVSLWATGGTLHAVDVTPTGDGVAIGTPKELFTFPPTGTDGTAIGYVYDVTSDGKRFLFEIATSNGLTNAMRLVVDWRTLER